MKNCSHVMSHTHSSIRNANVTVTCEKKTLDDQKKEKEKQKQYTRRKKKMRHTRIFNSLKWNETKQFLKKTNIRA